MTFKKGDKVKFLNDVGGGIVTRVENKTIYVCNEDGFDIPALASQLLKVEVSGNTTPFTSAPKAGTVPAEKETAFIAPIAETSASSDFINLASDTESNIDPTVKLLLAWKANRKKNGKTSYDLYLINDCGYHIMYVAAMITQGIYQGIQAGILESETTIHLTEIEGADLKEITKVRLECLFYKKGSFMPQEPMKYELVIDEFYMTDAINYTSNEYFEEKALILNISEEFLLAEIENVAKELQAKFEKQKKHIDKPKSRPIVKKTEEEKEEIDLHIEQLVDNPKELSSAEMLEIQMARFNIAIEGAMRRRQKRIIFIHGVGNGRLRLEIRRALDQQFKLRYQDASFKEYGYGATLVFL